MMIAESKKSATTVMRKLQIVKATGEEPLFKTGEPVKISVRYPVGHYRVPHFIRGKRGVVEMIIKPPAVNNEEEGFGRNAGIKGYYYRVALPLTELWPDYVGSPQDGLRIEIFETWLERI
jgi:nitrile hydratase subunit beta